MNSIGPHLLALKYAKLPRYILDLRTAQLSGHPAWAFDLIPAVIEAARAVGLINRGGDLQILTPEGGRGESWNFGVWVFDPELASAAIEKRVDMAAEIALEKYRDLGGQDALLQEAVAYMGGRTLDPRQALHFEWYLDEPAY